MRNSTLDVLIWVLIYGGLIVVCLGIFLRRSAESLGWTFITAGGGLAALGAVLVVVRAGREPMAGKGEDKS